MTENSQRNVTAVSQPTIGLAVASLVLGILAVVLGILVLGALLGLLGLILGIVHQRRSRTARTMAWWGIELSIFGMLVGASAGIGYYLLFSFMRENMASFQGLADEQAKMWEGVQAPDLTVSTLEGQTLTLSELKGKRVVLDFWATWCPPCRQEIPHFVQLAKEVPREDLVIVGISKEPKDTLTDFAAKNKVNYALATAQDLPAPYGEVEAFPTTFFIDRKGVIQSVFVGYHDLEALRAQSTGPDFAGEAKEKPAMTAAAELSPAEHPLTPEMLWTLALPGASAICAGDWDADQAEEVLVADRAGKLHVIGQDGVEKQSISLPGSFAAIEMGRHGNSGACLLGYSNWGKKISVTDGTGKELWTYGSMWGVDGAHWGDLDGDGTDEMIVGMNGAGGLHAVSGEGKVLWKTHGLGNVWNQAVISATAEREALVVATEASGGIHVFDKEGNKVRTMRPSGRYYAEMTAARMDSGGAVQIIAIGKGMKSEGDSRAVVCDETGRVAWTAGCQDSNSSWRNVNFACGDVNGDGIREWVFLGSDGSLVVASMKGEQISSLPVTKAVDGFAAVSEASGKGFLALLQSGNSLTAYRFQ